MNTSNTANCMLAPSAADIPGRISLGCVALPVLLFLVAQFALAQSGCEQQHESQRENDEGDEPQSMSRHAPTRMGHKHGAGRTSSR